MIGFGGVAYALGMLPILSWILVSPCHMPGLERFDLMNITCTGPVGVPERCCCVV